MNKLLEKFEIRDHKKLPSHCCPIKILPLTKCDTTPTNSM